MKIFGLLCPCRLAIKGDDIFALMFVGVCKWDTRIDGIVTFGFLEIVFNI
jgi:hypothetical protein